MIFHIVWIIFCKSIIIFLVSIPKIYFFSKIPPTTLFFLRQFDCLYSYFILNFQNANLITISSIFFSIQFLNYLFFYLQDSKFGLNCWIWVIHLNISFLHRQFDCLLQIFIQKKKRIRKNGIDMIILDNNLIIINIFDLLFFYIS